MRQPSKRNILESGCNRWWRAWLKNYSEMRAFSLRLFWPQTSSQSRYYKSVNLQSYRRWTVSNSNWWKINLLKVYKKHIRHLLFGSKASDDNLILLFLNFLLIKWEFKIQSFWPKTSLQASFMPKTRSIINLNYWSSWSFASLWTILKSR